MREKLIYSTLMAGLFLGALAFRLPRLGQRPMHADEAVQAVRFRQLWWEGQYRYDPHEFHAPTLVYATLPSVWLERPKSFADTSSTTYRIVPVVVGSCTLLLLWLLADALGKPATVLAAILLVISPATVYYSRYYIHETLFAFFTLMTIAAAWRYARGRRLAACLAAGAGIGLMQATKETSVIVYGAMIASLVLSWLWTWRPGRRRTRKGSWPPWKHLAASGIVALAVAAVLYSSFMTNPRGLLDAAVTYIPWASRAGGASPHVHPWYYYLNILCCWHTGRGPWWSEGLIVLLASIGLLAGLFPQRLAPRGSDPAMLRWLAFYTLCLTAAYSAIAYKTPWCLLGFLQGMILLAGVGAVALLHTVPTRPLKCLIAILLLLAAGQLAWQSYQASYVLATDTRNPYAYTPTMPDIERLEHDVEQLSLASGQDGALPINVIWHDSYYWPLPWYLRRFQHVGYWTRMPEDPSAPIVISTPQLDAPLTRKLDATHLMTGYYAIRPNVLAQLWVRLDLWEAHLKRLGRL